MVCLPTVWEHPGGSGGCNRTVWVALASVLEPGVVVVRRLRLHAGKYILGITAPTGTGVQALPHLG